MRETGLINLRENPSTISSLVLLLGLISRFPTNELRVATNVINNAKMPPNRLRFSYDIQECLIPLFHTGPESHELPRIDKYLDSWLNRTQFVKILTDSHSP